MAGNPDNDLLPFMITTRKTPLNCAIMAACQWLKRHPGMKADPEILLEFVYAWLQVTARKDGTITEETARQCGIHAVKECAGCVREIELIEPEDLRD